MCPLVRVCNNSSKSRAVRVRKYAYVVTRREKKKNTRNATDEFSSPTADRGDTGLGRVVPPYCLLRPVRPVWVTGSNAPGLVPRIQYACGDDGDGTIHSAGGLARLSSTSRTAGRGRRLARVLQFVRDENLK